MSITTNNNNSKENKNLNIINNVRKIESLGDYPIFGRYFIFIVILMELLWLPQMANITFMIYGGYTPIVRGCGNETFVDMTRDEACQLLTKIQENDTCQPVIESEFYSIIQEFEYYCQPEVRSSSVSLHMLGLLLGSIFYGQMSDLYGRRKMMLIGLFFAIIFGSLSSFSKNLFVFNVFQFINLFCTSAISTIGMIYLMELFPKKHRFWALLVISFSPNYILSSIIAYFTQEWRLLIVIINIINIIAFILLVLAKESPRWLIQNGDVKEAKIIYEKLEKLNGSYSDERQQILNILIDKELSLLEDKKKQKSYYFYHLFSTFNFIKYCFVLSFSLFVASMLSYALIYNMEQLSGSIFINNALLGFARFVINIFIGIMDLNIKKLGRKTLIYISLIVVMLSYMFIFISQVCELELKYIINIIIIIALAMTSQIFPIALVLTGELFPTPIRNVADSLQQIFVRIGAVIAPHVILLTSFLWEDLPFLFMTIMVLITIICYTLIPETKGNPMSDHMPHKTETIFYKKKKTVIAPKEESQV